jgi:hypothetical protein
LQSLQSPDIKTQFRSKNIKRDTGCLGIPGSTYTYGNTTFNVTCDTSFTYVSEQASQIIFTDTIEDCMDACVDFDGLAPCTAIQFDQTGQNVGPDGGDLCYLLWNMMGAENLTDSVHIAQSITARSSTVCPV